MKELNDIRFNKTNGGMGRTAASEDPVSGLIFGGFGEDTIVFGDNDGDLSGFAAVTRGDEPVAHIRKFQYPEQLAGAGIVWTENGSGLGTNGALTASEIVKNVLYYHISEFFRLSEKGTLYVMIKEDVIHAEASDVDVLQRYANGTIRQCGVFDGTVDIAALQQTLTSLEKNHMPMSVVAACCGEDTSLNDLTGSASLVVPGRCNVSVLIGCDGDTSLRDNLDAYYYFGCIGACIGAISKAAVNECIAWVQKFPLGLKVPALYNGLLMKDVSIQDQELMNGNHYIFVRTHVGDADNYFNDSHTLDEDTSDYAYIENVRTIDKACRGVRTNMLPYLNAPLKVDAETGKLDAPMVAFLETTAGKALEDMEKAGELSGYKAEIDPEQNVLSTGEIEVVIKQVPVGVMRKINVKIGFATKL